MNRALTFGAVATAVFFTLACGGAGDLGGMSSGADNVAACKTYLEAYNALECVPKEAKLSDSICPDNLNMTPIDMTEYYTCMAENSKCNGDIPDLAGQANCKAPGM